MNDNSDIDILISNAMKCTNLKQYTQAEEIVTSILTNNDYLLKLNSGHWQSIANILLILGKFELAQNSYVKANNLPGVAFALILKGNLDEANNTLLKALPSPAASWCRFLIELFSGARVTKWPSFLLIRHFLEFAVYHLLLARQEKYISILLSNSNRLLRDNLHCEKLIGLAYFHYGDLDGALTHFHKSLQHDQQDGELYFFLGQLYLERKQIFEAVAALESAHLLSPDHTPTTELLEQTKLKL